MILPAGPFGAILADPPWRFLTYDGKRSLPSPSGSKDHYPTTATADLKQLPIADLAAPDCALIMWHSGTHTDQAIELGRAWGFRFIRSEVFIWLKTREGYRPVPGMGYWSRNGGEIAALFTRGSPKRLSKGVEQIILCKRGAHSAKPDQQYERIEALFGGPYLELFARSRRAGWSSWGSEVGIRDGSLFQAAE